jgi:hypothetical protein
MPHGFVATPQDVEVCEGLADCGLLKRVEEVEHGYCASAPPRPLPRRLGDELMERKR